MKKIFEIIEKDGRYVIIDEHKNIVSYSSETKDWARADLYMKAAEWMRIEAEKAFDFGVQTNSQLLVENDIVYQKD